MVAVIHPEKPTDDDSPHVSHPLIFPFQHPKFKSLLPGVQLQEWPVNATATPLLINRSCDTSERQTQLLNCGVEALWLRTVYFFSSSSIKLQ